jgi:hypothetical protein
MRSKELRSSPVGAVTILSKPERENQMPLSALGVPDSAFFVIAGGEGLPLHKSSRQAATGRLRCDQPNWCKTTIVG